MSVCVCVCVCVCVSQLLSTAARAPDTDTHQVITRLLPCFLSAARAIGHHSKVPQVGAADSMGQAMYRYCIRAALQLAGCYLLQYHTLQMVCCGSAAFERWSVFGYCMQYMVRLLSDTDACGAVSLSMGVVGWAGTATGE